MTVTCDLVRYAKLPERTLGRLTLRGDVQNLGRWWTVENPWLNNQVNVSCIPDGQYEMVRYDSPTFGPCWMVKDVPNRTYILIHVANTEADVRGCIGLGKGVYPDLKGVSHSRDAIEEFHAATEGHDTMNLVIRTGALGK